jgi:hypothetical protein
MRVGDRHSICLPPDRPAVARRPQVFASDLILQGLL